MAGLDTIHPLSLSLASLNPVLCAHYTDATSQHLHEMMEGYSRLHVAKKAKPKRESSIVAFTKLLSVPTILLIVIASLDNADKQLLASSFPIFENLLNWNVKELGYFSLATNLSYALSLPVWGWLIHQYSGTRNLQKLLAYACGAWGIAMISIAVATLSASTTSSKTGTVSSFWIHIQISVRAMNGAALGSILPLSQSLLVEYVPANYRGQAFGLMGAGEKLAGTLSSAAVVYLGENHWQYAYYGLGILSIVMGFLARYMSLGSTESITNARQHAVAEQEKKATEVLTLRDIVQRIIRLPAFICLVAQGVFGGTPWDMMSYLLLLMDWRGFTNDQKVALQFLQGISSMIGGWLGGVFGDYAASRNGSQGRIFVALLSVVGGIPLYGLYLYSTNFRWAMVWTALFNVIATFTPAAAIRPICADLTNGPSERAQIVALWIVLEKTSGALFGAPLVGYLTERMLETSNQNGQQGNEQKAQALAYNLFTLSSFFWGVCSLFWAIMLVTLKNGGNVEVLPSPSQSKRRFPSPV